MPIRAGQNLSNDTRVQVYAAYARSWFRDFNYHSNSDMGWKNLHWNSLLTRFALPDPKDETLHQCATDDCENEPPLTAMKDILPKRESKMRFQYY